MMNMRPMMTMSTPAAADIWRHGCRDPDRVSHHTVLAIAALLFAASAAVTIVWSAAMAGMGEIPMPGGWTLSMAWMPACGQTWLGSAASFLGMWIVMMMAMMLPSLMPM